MMKRKKILMSDDVELFLMVEKTVFNREEFGLITARSGYDMIKLVEKEDPDLVFIDPQASDLDPGECCRLIKGKRTIPVILVSERSPESGGETFSEMGGDDILYKPIDRLEFLNIIRKYLNVKERVAERIYSRIPIKYSVASHEKYMDFSVNINSGGIFLETGKPFTVNTSFNLEFQLPTTETIIRCRARGAWTNDPENRRKPDLPVGIGLQFMDISTGDRNAIMEYINNGNVLH